MKVKIWSSWATDLFLNVLGLPQRIFSKSRVDGFTPCACLVIIRKQLVGDIGLLAHELVHVDQIKKEGWFKMVYNYAWYLVLKGYHDNPYEVEARKKKNNKKYKTLAKALWDEYAKSSDKKR